LHSNVELNFAQLCKHIMIKKQAKTNGYSLSNILGGVRSIQLSYGGMGV